MNSGYVKLWRKSIDGGWLSNHVLWCFWCYCLMKASHKPTKVLIGFQEVFLQKGQFIFGRKKCSKELNTSERSVRTCLHTLKTTNNLTIKTTNKFSIITVVNWELYQDDDRKTGHQNDHQSDQQPTNNRPTTDHIQECKEDKEDNLLVGLESQTADRNGHIPYEDIKNLYNKILDELPHCKFMTDKRRKQIKSCWHQEKGRTDTLEFWSEFFEFVKQSEFLMGKTVKPWNGCNLEWITKIGNFIKIREGSYS